MMILNCADYGITSEQLRVWQTFLQAHTAIRRRLEEELLDQHDMPILWFEVLGKLVEAENRRLRMNELAEQAMISPSGLTRIVDRMTSVGLLRRTQVEADGRGFYASLTETGYQRLREATRTHLRGIRAHVIDRFTDAELRLLGDLLGRFNEGVTP